MTQEQQPVQPQPQYAYVQRPITQYDPTRKYLSASNFFFLALKVFGYNVVGYLIIVIPIFIILLALSQA